MEAIRALLFDFGNVVGYFDHRIASGRLARLGGVPEEELHRFLFGGKLEADLEAGVISTEDFLQYLRQYCRFSCSDRELTAAYSEIFTPNPEIADLLPGLHRRYRLILASNTSVPHSNGFRRQFSDVLQHFDALVLSHEIGARKPSAAFFDKCLQAAQSSPEQCLFVDDLPANVEGAVARGIHGIVFKGVEDLRQRAAALGVIMP